MSQKQLNIQSSQGRIEYTGQESFNDGPQQQNDNLQKPQPLSQM